VRWARLECSPTRRSNDWRLGHALKAQSRALEKEGAGFESADRHSRKHQAWRGLARVRE
jgi:hypothetical protein